MWAVKEREGENRSIAETVESGGNLSRKVWMRNSRFSGVDIGGERVEEVKDEM